MLHLYHYDQVDSGHICLDCACHDPICTINQHLCERESDGSKKRRGNRQKARGSYRRREGAREGEGKREKARAREGEGEQEKARRSEKARGSKRK